MKIILWLFILCPGFLASQSIGRQVIGSTGSISDGTISSSSVGPSILFTENVSDSLTITQGFQQPSGSTLNVELISTPATCINPTGGSVQIIPSGCTGAYEILWENQNSDDLIENLTQGTYNYTVTSGSCVFVGTIAIGFDDSCGEAIPNVLTLNNDGANETWIIPLLYDQTNTTNQVEIFNRWGQLIWKVSNYDNIDTIWNGTNNQNETLNAGTYFYKITLPAELITGYIELFK